MENPSITFAANNEISSCQLKKNLDTTRSVAQNDGKINSHLINSFFWCANNKYPKITAAAAMPTQTPI
ncbi:hypothetical protein [Desulfitobacterium hafniense]|uniref:hypothetical protein n=1 Tax=Desulfitobacterium hafniense TaxID=49338 RepID=UPI0012F91E04|nr:hypothetical protein [Desulfitobacterium hafniense]